MPSSRHTPCPRSQRGVTLTELLVGVIMGLMVVAVAITALMTSRAVSGDVGDASRIQQQASWIFRTIGQQVRQAGGMHLNMAADKPSGAAFDEDDAVKFERSAPSVFNPRTDAIAPNPPGASDYQLSVGYLRHEEQLHSLGGAHGSIQRDCLGEAGSGLAVIRSSFRLQNHQLFCKGAGSEQPIAENVAEFQLRYLVQNGAAIRYAHADAVADWGDVLGVEVCLVLFGTQGMDLPSGSAYTDCSGSSVQLASLGANRRNKVHMAFRTVYQLRSRS